MRDRWYPLFVPLVAGREPWAAVGISAGEPFAPPRPLSYCAGRAAMARVLSSIRAW